MKLIAKLAGAFDDLPDFLIWMMVGGCAMMATFYIGQSNGYYAAESKYKPQVTALEGAMARQETAHKRALGKVKEDSAATLRTLQEQYDDYRNSAVKTRTIIKEVPKYVTTFADAQCVIPAGFVYVHNASLAPEAPAVPSSPPRDANAPSGVALSTVAEVTAANNAECAERGVILKMWQEWYPKAKSSYEGASLLMEGAAITP